LIYTITVIAVSTTWLPYWQILKIFGMLCKQYKNIKTIAKTKHYTLVQDVKNRNVKGSIGVRKSEH
jgi:hypothetical protein